MSICPKGKVSKSRRNTRRSQSWKISVPSLVKCPQCGSFKVSHRVCPECGKYNKREVIAVAQ
ncbi:MAG: 50S ribosomal protein L32 [Clostridiales bacterium]|nr:50S ribosomal protein L32 [Clostridiales bacterium]